MYSIYNRLLLMHEGCTANTTRVWGQELYQGALPNYFCISYHRHSDVKGGVIRAVTLILTTSLNPQLSIIVSSLDLGLALLRSFFMGCRFQNTMCKNCMFSVMKIHLIHCICVDSDLLNRSHALLNRVHTLLNRSPDLLNRPHTLL